MSVVRYAVKHLYSIYPAATGVIGEKFISENVI